MAPERINNQASAGWTTYGTFLRRCYMTRLSLFPRLLAAGALLLFFIAAPCESRAQTTFGSITGNVTDANGAIVAGATIEATHVGRNYRYTARSNEVGNFTIPQLREGEYSL